MKVSIYRNAKDNKGAIRDISLVLSAIRSGKYREHVRALRDMSKEEYDDKKKEMLPAVTFSGTFSPTRSIGNCVTYNSIVTIDIDNLDDEKIMDIQDRMSSDPYVMCMFVSPSGEGLKMLVPVSSEKDNHYDAFKCLELYFKTNYDITIDPSGKDPCRLCFVSFDPELYYNGSAQRFPVEISEETRNRVYSDREVAYKGFNITSDDEKKFAVCREWASFYKPYQDGNRNNHVHKLSCDMNRCGIPQDNAVLMIARSYTDFPVAEIKDCVRNAYNNKDQHNTINVFDFEAEQDGMRGMMEFHTASSLIDKIMSNPVGDLIPTGFSKRDAVLGGGLARGSLYAYVGREKTFKSVDAMCTALFLAKQGRSVLYLNGEMSDRQFLMIVAQQELGIKRMDFDKHLHEIAKYMKEHLSTLCVVSGSDFTQDNIIKTCDSINHSLKKEVDLVILDGLTHMKWPDKDEIRSAINNSVICKEVVKKANGGKGVAMIVLIHTNSQSQMWNRGPQQFVRGGMKVMANMDGSVGFSKFIEPASISDESSPEFRNDVYHVRVIDYRMTGDSVNTVMDIDSQKVKPSESDSEPFMYEIKQEDNNYKR